LDLDRTALLNSLFLFSITTLLPLHSSLLLLSSNTGHMTYNIFYLPLIYNIYILSSLLHMLCICHLSLLCSICCASFAFLFFAPYAVHLSDYHLFLLSTTINTMNKNRSKNPKNAAASGLQYTQFIHLVSHSAHDDPSNNFIMPESTFS
jgi:hypothetical protein